VLWMDDGAEKRAVVVVVVVLWYWEGGKVAMSTVTRKKMFLSVAEAEGVSFSMNCFH